MLTRILGRAVTAILVVTALALACWFALSFVTGATLITFRTGSMSPTMPQGALAVTMPVRADELEVGDVVTVRRAGETLPVTHRVVEIAPIAEEPPSGGADLRAAAPDAGPPDLADSVARQLVLKGDDNDTPDQLPYLVTDVRRVVFSAPQLGNVVMLIQSPIGMGTLIVLVGLLTTWAFWPKRIEKES